MRASVWDLRKVGRARDCEWVASSRARLGLGSQVCRAALSRCGANGDCQIPGPSDDMGAVAGHGTELMG